jgi:hypothetical protein
MHTGGQVPDLEQLAATQLAACLAGVPVGSRLAIDSSSEVCFTLERLIPEILSSEHPEWRRESIDGFFIASAIKSDEDSAELAGTCILISDQTVTPFALNLSLLPSRRFGAVRIRLGEPGGGRLCISGPGCNSWAAQNMLLALNARLESVHWAYDLAL